MAVVIGFKPQAKWLNPNNSKRTTLRNFRKGINGRHQHYVYLHVFQENLKAFVCFREDSVSWGPPYGKGNGGHQDRE